MKMNKQWAAALCLFAVAGCASDRMGADTPSAASSSGGAAPASSMTGDSDRAQASYGVVQAIDQMQRQDVGIGVVGAAAVGGSTAMPSDKIYRVTVRMDDGANQMVVVDSMPSYKIGDRVRYSDGALIAY